MPSEIVIIGAIAGIFGILGAIVGIIQSMISPIKTQMRNLEMNTKDAEIRARTELDKSERGLKEQTIRVEGIIRQTVEDVDNKLRRESELIEEKTRIQFSDQQRQIEQLRVVTEQNRIDVWKIRNGIKHKEDE